MKNYNGLMKGVPREVALSISWLNASERTWLPSAFFATDFAIPQMAMTSSGIPDKNIHFSL